MISKTIILHFLCTYNGLLGCLFLGSFIKIDIPIIQTNSEIANATATTTQYDKSVSNGQKLIFHPLISEYKNTTFGFFVTFYDVIDHI